MLSFTSLLITNSGSTPVLPIIPNQLMKTINLTNSTADLYQIIQNTVKEIYATYHHTEIISEKQFKQEDESYDYHLIMTIPNPYQGDLDQFDKYLECQSSYAKDFSEVLDFFIKQECSNLGIVPTVIYKDHNRQTLINVDDEQFAFIPIADDTVHIFQHNS